ncbi:MAG: hypothetical protein A2073_01850 [Deltaproteobacteria bacterium GWC2_42_11]|nr:MAG: hypothetical protein A2073_01850 [Deltaproteobacteria bacterium GWC2_42_11]
MILVAILTIVLGIYLLARYGEKIYEPVVRQIVPAKTKMVSLYFSEKDGSTLNIEKREIKKGERAAEIKETVEELIKGPSGKLIPTIPLETKLLNVTIKGGTAYIDFSSDISTRHPGGSFAEIQTVYSIVNTAAVNFPEVKNVQILISGKKAKTIAGHIDISFPLTADTTK